MSLENVKIGDATFEKLQQIKAQIRDMYAKEISLPDLIEVAVELLQYEARTKIVRLARELKSTTTNQTRKEK